MQHPNLTYYYTNDPNPLWAWTPYHPHAEINPLPVLVPWQGQKIAYGTCKICGELCYWKDITCKACTGEAKLQQPQIFYYYDKPKQIIYSTHHDDLALARAQYADKREKTFDDIPL